MNDNELQLLKSSVDKVVKIHCSDGEVLIAKVIFVWDEYEDVSVDVVSTDRPEKYEKYGPDAAHTLNFKDILSVEASPGAAPSLSPK